MRRLLPLLLLASCAAPPEPSDPPPARLRDGKNVSGGVLCSEQAAYDVVHYDLSIAVDPEKKSIRGTNVVTVRVLAPMGHLVLDLDRPLTVTRATSGGRELSVRRNDGMLSIALESWKAPGDLVSVAVEYAGVPRVAVKAPWDGGFVWAKTASGQPWIATACQGEGADLWWPCKDHPSDKPETMDLRVTIPEGLFCASNGTLEENRKNGDGTRTLHWAIRSPISNYNVALNIAPYEELKVPYTSVTGEPLKFSFWVLPEDVEKGRKALAGFERDLRFYEEVCGPYPFRAEKYGVVETPHLGMEHQSIVGYGNGFRADPDGYDWLHHHELSHEWWGNLVTCRDWKDFWIHEGIGTYMQALYLERLRGPEGYRKEMAKTRRQIRNEKALAPRVPTDSKDGYFSDIYFKGSWVMHTLRWLLGDEVFFLALRRMAYPDPAKERVTDGSQVRFSDTEEIRGIAERVSGKKLDWFFDVYLRQPELPQLVVEEGFLRWKTPGNLPFPMPVPVKVGGTMLRLEPGARLPDEAYELDPDLRLLRRE
jgi:aminopeptidase N